MMNNAPGQYAPTIGIECHVQLKSRTKLFAAVGNDARNAEPNTLISHICLGLPGALPVLNEQALVLATKAALALGTRPEQHSQFDRKHYFYPDLPFGYQITQFYEPIIRSGLVHFACDGQSFTVRIHEAHLEADAGKSTHPVGKDFSLVDLNRAGTPLLEIVSEPDMHSAAEARAYAQELYLLMKHAQVSDVDLYHGNMRFDVNVSVSKTHLLGVRTETKNLNSFKSIEKAVEYEISRQIQLLEDGMKIVQETRGWDDAKQKTFSQRSKEDAHDYRYMPEPDIPPTELSNTYVDDIAADMPLMPADYRKIFRSIALDSAIVEKMLQDPQSCRLVQNIAENSGSTHAKRVALWVSNVVSAENTTSNLSVSSENAVKLSQLVEQNQLSSTAAKEVWIEICRTNNDPEEFAASKGLLQVSNEETIQAIVKQVLSENIKAVEDVKKGEAKAIGFLVGQVMKLSKGSANPELAQKLIKHELGL